MKNFAFIAAIGVVAGSALATPLPIGGTVSPVGTFPHTVDLDTIVQPLTPSTFSCSVFSGTLYSGIVLNSADNPFGPGHLTFVYYAHSDSTSVHSIGRFTVIGFGSFGTDVGIDPLSSPAQLNAFENNRPIANELGWSFLNAPPLSQIGPGADSSYFVVHTDATTYSWSDASLIDGDIATAHAWAPVPTPGTGALLGLGTLAAFRRRR